MKLRVSEQFLTVQGEGSMAGRPSYFVRTSGCNLRCWWCDTPYTSWKPEGGMLEVADIAEAALASKAPCVVVTGGEPMLFAPQVGALARQLRSAGRHVTVETNGTIWSDDVAADLWSVSPKLRSSRPKEAGAALELHETQNTHQQLSQFVRGPSEYQLKFVVSAPSELDEVERVVAESGASRASVWLMPEGVQDTVVMERGRWLAEECKARGFNLALRQHVLLWGHRRGV